MENFYQMAEENCSTLVIMLCPCKEDDKQMSAEYFPTREEPADKVYSNYKVSLVDESEPLKDLLVRRLQVTNLQSDKVFDLTHMQELEWLDNKAPASSSTMQQKMLFLVEQIAKQR